MWIINEFELDCTIHGRKTCDTEGATTNTNFAKKVQLTMSAICKHEKPFLLETKDLMTFDSHNCSHLPEIVNIQNMHSPGRKQYTEYVSNVLRIGTSSINNKIKMSSMYIFQKCKVSKAKGKTKVKEIKLDFFLKSNLLLVCKTWDIDLKNLSSHGNNNYPPSMSNNGYFNLLENESDVLKKIEIGKTSGSVLPKAVDEHVFDDPGAMYSLKGKVSYNNIFGDMRYQILLTTSVGAL